VGLSLSSQATVTQQTTGPLADEGVMAMHTPSRIRSHLAGVLTVGRFPAGRARAIVGRVNRMLPAVPEPAWRVFRGLGAAGGDCHVDQHREGAGQ